MRARRLAVWIAAVATLTILRFASAPPWPDDWDGIGFVESIRRFDLDHFTPHPPGYPVYVAMLRAAALVARGPVAAANLVAVASGVTATVLLAWASFRAFRDAERAAWLAAFTAVVPLVWRASTAIGSEAPALAAACAAIFGATMRRDRAGWWIGAAIGVGLGIRLSWAPLFLTFIVLVPSGGRIRAALAALGTSLAWAIPFASIVGVTHLVRLAEVHATGHFRIWGGTTLSEPGWMRLAYLARDLFVDGLGVDRDALGVSIAALGLAVLGLGLRSWQARGWVHARVVLFLVPYLLWVALGQNLRQQPRHALPLVVALAAVLALAATSSLRARVLGVALVGLVAMRTAGDAGARRAIAPAGAQLVGLVRDLPESPRIAVFAGPSARFFELAPSAASAATVGTLGDARLALGRASSLPARVILTSELEGLDASSGPLVHLATLCRPPRIDRRAPCLDVYDWRAPFLRRP